MKLLFLPLNLKAILPTLGLGLAVLFFFGGKPGPCLGASASKDLSVVEITNRVEEAQTSIQDVQMDLSLDMKDGLTGSQQTLKGVIKMKSPNKIFVHYTQPTEQFLYVGGSMMRMYQPDQKTIYEQRTGKGVDATPMYLGVGKELKRYMAVSHVTIIKDTDSEIGLLFIPLKDNAGFDKMRVYIHKKDWWPYEMEVETPSMTSKARFSNFSFNQGLKDALFEFTPPKGAQIVEGAIF